ncbi:MAG: glycosyltransferase family 9 protein [Gammaproteobacteria bacterium]|nr:glycosyltransferase family 9 protein [Gammaproteobacteria bacterium]
MSEKLCVLRLSAIGDTCHTLPVVRAIQDHLPAAELSWVIGSLEHQLLGDIDGIRFIPYNKRGGKAAVQSLKRDLGEQRFDALLHMQVALRASLLSRHVKADRRIGFDRARARDWQWLFTNERIAAGDRQHVMDGLLGFLEPLGIPRPARPRWDIPLPATAREFASRTLGDRPALVISPCSSQRARNFRNWAVERYVAVIEHARMRGLEVILSGGPSELEREYGERISAAVDCRNLIGKTSLKELMALLAAARVVISPDSGPVHMANAAGTPVVGLYATSNPDRTGPYHHRELVANRYPDALDQYLGKSVDQVRWGQRVRHPDAMDLISVDDVTGKLDLALELGA